MLVHLSQLFAAGNNQSRINPPLSVTTGPYKTTEILILFVVHLIIRAWRKREDLHHQGVVGVLLILVFIKLVLLVKN